MQVPLRLGYLGSYGQKYCAHGHPPPTPPGFPPSLRIFQRPGPHSADDSTMPYVQIGKCSVASTPWNTTYQSRRCPALPLILVGISLCREKTAVPQHQHGLPAAPAVAALPSSGRSWRSCEYRHEQIMSECSFRRMTERERLTGVARSDWSRPSPGRKGNGRQGNTKTQRACASCFGGGAMNKTDG